MPDLYDLTIEHFDAEHGHNETDFWEDVTYEYAQERIAWHAANTKLLSVELERVGEGDPPRPATVIGHFKSDDGVVGVAYSRGDAGSVQRTGPMPTPKEGAATFTAYPGYMTTADLDGVTVKLAMKTGDVMEVIWPEPKD